MRYFEVSTKFYKALATVMRNPEQVLYPLKVNSTSHTLVMLKHFLFCDSARQELTGHFRLLV